MNEMNKINLAHLNSHLICRSSGESSRGFMFFQNTSFGFQPKCPRSPSPWLCPFSLRTFCPIEGKIQKPSPGMDCIAITFPVKAIVVVIVGSGEGKLTLSRSVISSE